MLKLMNLFLVVGVAVLLIGCENGSEQAAPTAEPVATTEPGAGPAAEPAAEPVGPASQDGEPTKATEGEPTVEITPWDEIIETVSSSGKPAVLDVWSLVCQPCLEEFPGLVRLHKQLGDQVACYSADVDFDGRKTRPPETYRPRVEAFLQQVDAAGAFPHFISATSSDEVYTKLDVDSIPTVVVFAADGTIAKKFVDAGETAGFTYNDDVIPFVKSMVTEPAPPAER